MQHIADAARRLFIEGGGEFDSVDAARSVVDGYVTEQGIQVDAEGFMSDNDYDDVIYELKGAK